MTYVEPGYLLFVENGALHGPAVRHDEASARWRADAESRTGSRTSENVGNGSFAASTNGVLAYQGAGSDVAVVWSDRRGNIDRYGLADAGLRHVSHSRRTASAWLSMWSIPRTGTADIWIYDTARGAPGPIHVGSGSTRAGPCGRRTAAASCIGSTAAGPRVSASDRRRRICTRGSSAPGEKSWSWPTRVRFEPRGLVARRPMDRLHPKHQANRPRTSGSCRCLMVRKPWPFSNERFDERDATFSPDSRWLAFVSTEAGLPGGVRRAGGASRATEHGSPMAAGRRRAGAAMARSCSMPRRDGRAIVRVPHRSLGSTLDGRRARRGCSPSAPRPRPASRAGTSSTT